MARKGQFKKGGGRVGGGSHRARRRVTTKTIVVAAPRSPSRRSSHAPRKKHRRSHRRGSAGRLNLLHVGLATAGLAFLTGKKAPTPMIRDTAMKIPGAKTFGAAAIIGIGALAADRFIKPNKWLKLLGVAGVVLAASKIGDEGTDFKFVGDDDDIADFDDDVGDDDLEDVGDDYDE